MSITRLPVRMPGMHDEVFVNRYARLPEVAEVLTKYRGQITGVHRRDGLFLRVDLDFVTAVGAEAAHADFCKLDHGLIRPDDKPPTSTTFSI